MLLGQIQLNGSHAEGFFPSNTCFRDSWKLGHIQRKASVEGENSPGRQREAQPRQETDRSDAAWTLQPCAERAEP